MTFDLNDVCDGDLQNGHDGGDDYEIILTSLMSWREQLLLTVRGTVTPVGRRQVSSTHSGGGLLQKSQAKVFGVGAMLRSDED